MARLLCRTVCEADNFSLQVLHNVRTLSPAKIVTLQAISLHEQMQDLPGTNAVCTLFTAETPSIWHILAQNLRDSTDSKTRLEQMEKRAGKTKIRLCLRTRKHT